MQPGSQLAKLEVLALELSPGATTLLIHSCFMAVLAFVSHFRPLLRHGSVRFPIASSHTVIIWQHSLLHSILAHCCLMAALAFT